MALFTTFQSFHIMIYAASMPRAGRLVEIKIAHEVD
jgi:hypothetical protein